MRRPSSHAQPVTASRLALDFGECPSGVWGDLPAEGFEPPTYGLQNRCTTAVLSRHGASPR
jgi:hypothetical protein